MHIKGIGTTRASRRFMALWAMTLAFNARPAEAAPFVYMTNTDADTVTVIDAATNTVTATLSGMSYPLGVAATPDGKFVYVANENPSNTVSVIETATNTITATIPFPAGSGEVGLAVTPDGKFVYVANNFSNTVSVIATATNTVTTTVAVGNGPVAVAVTPDGKFVYVTGSSRGSTSPSTVSVIATATNTVVATVMVASSAGGVAVTPDGKFVYVTFLNSVSVIETATNTVTATVAVGLDAGQVAITPDGKSAYVANRGSSNVSVIDTATNTVKATVAVAGPGSVNAGPFGVAVTPDGKFVYVGNGIADNVSVIDTATNTVTATVAVRMANAFGFLAIARVPFAAFAASLEVALRNNPAEDIFALESVLTLASDTPPVNPLTDLVTLSIGLPGGAYSVTIPAGYFRQGPLETYTFEGVINGVKLAALISPVGLRRYAFALRALGANLTGIVDPAPVTLTIGDGGGVASCKALIFH